MESRPGTPSILNLAKCKCPRCRRGDMFVTKNPYNLKKFMTMNDGCELCSQPFDLEVGFYYGSSYISYALTLAISVATFVAWWILIGISINDNRIFGWLMINSILLIGLQPPLMRLARVGWLAFFVHYDKNWKTNPPKKLERTNDALKNAW
jgi:uncharacterized protein (DUF983 family)